MKLLKIRKKSSFVCSIFALSLFLNLAVLNAQNNTAINGKIVDNIGEPIIGASIIEKGTSNGTITDIDGNFVLNLQNKEASIIVSYIGMDSQTLIASPNMTITLNESAISLDEVVAIGYGTQKKKLVTGATLQLKGEDLTKLSTVSTLTALQSQTPGLSIIATSSRPDAEYKINIRGLGTIGNASPLIVINGIAGGDLRNIAPSDIQSIDVLKDAASAAIYGSRAANGVILITTKQGKAGKTSVTLDAYYGVQNIEKYMDMVDANDYMMLVNEAATNSGGAPIDFSTGIPANMWTAIQGGSKGTNWWKELSNVNAPVQNYALNITSGTDISTFSIGLSYTNQDAILGNPLKENLKRYSFRLNSDHVLLKKNNRNIIKFGENLLYTNKINSNRMNNAYRWASASPLMSVYDENGEYSKNSSITYADMMNPVAFQNYNSHNSNKSHDIRFNAYMEIQPIKNLIYRSNFGYSVIANSAREFLPVYELGTSGSSSRLKDQTTQSATLGIGYQFENTLTYNFRIAENHSVSALMGQSIEKTGLGEYISGSNLVSLFNSFEYAYLDNTKTIASGSTTLSGGPLGEWALSSFFGRVNYDYKEKYLLTALIRRDGSSKFARGNRWGNFPSASVGWVISNEPFMKSSEGWMDLLKIRASWGQNGNQEIPSFQYLSPFKFSGADYYFGTSKTTPTIGAYPNILSNVDITWETSEQFDFGIDSRFFNGRLQLALDLYDKKTKDWLVKAPILGSQGAGAPYINGGEITNKGIEFSLNWNDNIGDFKYGVSANYAYNQNEITRIANAQGLIEGTKINEYATGQLPPYRAEVGYPIGYFWGFKTAGVFQNQEQIDAYTGAKPNKVTKPGDLIFVDFFEDGIIDQKDRTIIGDPNPKGIFGFSFNMAYKGFDFAATGAGVSGNKIMTSYNSANAYTENYPSYLLNRWHGEGTSNRYPRLTSTPNTNYTYFSDIYLNDGGYLRIQNVTLGYDLIRLFPNFPMGQARIYVAAQNLYTFTKYIGANPEVGADSGVGTIPSGWAKGIDVNFNPNPRTFMVGANFKF